MRRRIPSCTCLDLILAVRSISNSGKKYCDFPLHFLRLNAHVVLDKMANSGGGQFSEDAQFPDRYAQPGSGELVPTTVLLPSRAVLEESRIGSRGVTPAPRTLLSRRSKSFQVVSGPCRSLEGTLSSTQDFRRGDALMAPRKNLLFPLLLFGY